MLPEAAPDSLWIHMIPSQVQFQDGNISLVSFEASQFDKGRTKFENENIGGGQSVVLARVKENLEPLLKETVGNIDQWLSQFKHGEEPLSECNLHDLLHISSLDSNCDGSNPEFEAALATAVMIEYGRQETASVEVIMHYISTLMQKLEPFILSAWQELVRDIWQELVTDIVKTKSDLQARGPNVIHAIQGYLKTRNKSAKSTIDVVQMLSESQDVSLLSGKARRLEALEQSLHQVCNGLSRSNSLALCTSDSFTLSERISAANPASTVMNTRSVVLNRSEVLAAQNAVWQILRLKAGLQVIFVTVTKAMLSPQEATPSIFVAEWLASNTDLSRRIHFHTIKKLIEDATGDFSDSRIVLLPAVSASDFNKVAGVTKTRPARFSENYRRLLGVVQKCVDIFTRPNKQPHAWFLHISDPCDSRFIGSSAIVSNPSPGLCLSKNINKVKACLLFSERAAPVGAEQPFPTFERSQDLFQAESLSAMTMRQGDVICNERLQASFDSLSWFSATHSKRCVIGSQSQNRVQTWSERQLLTDGTVNSTRRTAEILSQGRRLRQADGRGFSNIRESRYQVFGPDSSDDDRYAPTAGSANCMHDHEPLNCNDDDSQPYREMSQQEQTIQTLQRSTTTRYIQIDFANDKGGNEAGSSTVDAVCYMMVLPDVGLDGKVSRNPVVMYVQESKEAGHFVYCTCNLFSERAKVVQPSYRSTKEVWFFPDKQILLLGDEVKGYCSHASIRDSKVWQCFGEQVKLHWSGTQCSVTTIQEVEQWRQTSITVTAGLRVVENLQHVEVVNVKFASAPWYSVLRREGDNEHVNSHAFVNRTKRRHRMDKNAESEQQLQLRCFACESKLIQTSGRRSVCVHIQSVSRKLKKGGAYRAGDGVDADQVTSPRKPRQHFWGEYKPSLVVPDCSDDEKHTGFLYHNGTYTNLQHPLDYRWECNQLRFGHGFSFDIANKKNKVLEGLIMVGEGGSNPHYKVEKGCIIEGMLPNTCPRCNAARGLSEVQEMYIILYMSDLAVVRSSVDYFTCSNPGCKHCVHADGYTDGFWFLSKHIAISNMLIWNFITLQLEEHARDMTSYHRQCQIGLNDRMRSAGANLFKRSVFAQAYFVFISCLKISFNTGCYGCTSDALDAVPESKEHSHVQAFAARAPEGARDLACVGVDGLSSMFADTHDFEKEGPQTLPGDGDDGYTAEDKGNDASDPKSSFLGSCRCCKKKTNFASRQFDRSPIKKDDDKGSQAAATKLRKGFLDLGRLIRRSRNENLLMIQDDAGRPIQILYKSMETLIHQTKSRQQLLLVFGLATLCLQRNALCTHFNLDQTRQLLRYSGQFLEQLGASNSVLTLLKPGALRDCFALCDAFDNEEKDGSAMEETNRCLKTVLSLGQPRLATPGPIAATLTTLLQFVDLPPPSPVHLQSQVNRAIIRALRFVAERTQEVMVFHQLHDRPLSECTEAEIEKVREKGFNFPVPVRYPGIDVFKEFSDAETGTGPPSAPSNPVKDDGAYFFTKHGGCIREPPAVNGENDSGDCEKPGFNHSGRVNRAVHKLMAIFMFCTCHGMCIGYHATRNEGRKDPWNVFMRLKKTFPHNISYDFACG